MLPWRSPASSGGNRRGKFGIDPSLRRRTQDRDNDISETTNVPYRRSELAPAVRRRERRNGRGPAGAGSSAARSFHPRTFDATPRNQRDRAKPDRASPTRRTGEKAGAHRRHGTSTQPRAHGAATAGISARPRRAPARRDAHRHGSIR